MERLITPTADTTDTPGAQCASREIPGASKGTDMTHGERPNVSVGTAGVVGEGECVIPSIFVPSQEVSIPGKPLTA